jgi:hypothetical protein
MHRRSETKNGAADTARPVRLLASGRDGLRLFDEAIPTEKLA